MLITLTAQDALMLTLLWGAWGCGGEPPDQVRTATGAGECRSLASARPARGLVPRLRAYLRRGGVANELGDGAVVEAGDLIQLTYVAAGNRQGVVVSVDGEGDVTLHHPDAVAGSTALEPMGEHPLDHAFELDAAAGCERFYLVTSGDRPVDVGKVMDAAKRLRSDASSRPLALPVDLRQTSLTLRKAP